MAWVFAHGTRVLFGRNERIRRSIKIKNLLLYGGTFDPPHYGHLYPVQHVQKTLPFERVVFLPCKTPVLKQNTIATTEERLDMLTLALAPYPSWTIDCREITRESPSFMIDTLESFRKEFGPATALSLLIGADAFLELPQWHRWQDILTFCHLIVMHRTPNAPLSPLLHSFLSEYETVEKKRLLEEPCGTVYRCHAGDYPISSRDLRNKIKRGENIVSDIPTPVYQYLTHHKIYR